MIRPVAAARLAMRLAAESPLRFAVRIADVRRVRLRLPHGTFCTLRGDTGWCSLSSPEHATLNRAVKGASAH